MNDIFLHPLSGKQLDRTVILSIFSLRLLPPFLFYTFYEASSHKVIHFSVKNSESSIIPELKSYLSCVGYEEHHSMYFFLLIWVHLKSERFVFETFRQFFCASTWQAWGYLCGECWSVRAGSHLPRPWKGRRQDGTAELQSAKGRLWGYAAGSEKLRKARRYLPSWYLYANAKPDICMQMKKTERIVNPDRLNVKVQNWS